MIIYRIKNRLNGKIYIGQTVRSLGERLSEHKRHKKTLISKALKKYGINNFDIEVIDYSETIEELNEKEIFYIEKFGCISPNGYNICSGGNGTYGYHHKEDSKKLMSKNHWDNSGEKNCFYGKHHTEETKEKMRRYLADEEVLIKRTAQLNKYRYDSSRKVLEINENKTFDSLKDACNEYGISDVSYISRVCRGKRKSCFGHVFKYID